MLDDLIPQPDIDVKNRAPNCMAHHKGAAADWTSSSLWTPIGTSLEERGWINTRLHQPVPAITSGPKGFHGWWYRKPSKGQEEQGWIQYPHSTSTRYYLQMRPMPSLSHNWTRNQLKGVQIIHSNQDPWSWSTTTCSTTFHERRRWDTGWQLSRLVGSNEGFLRRNRP